MPFPNYELDDVDTPLLDAEIRALAIGSATFLGVTFCGVNCHVGFSSTPSAPDIAAIDSAVAAHTPKTELQKAKCVKVKAIDARTMELIYTGFEYPPSSGQMFSLSQEGQSRLNGINQVRDHASVIYPVRWNFLDDSGAIDLVDAEVILNFYLTAIGTYRTYVDSGTSLKDSVRAASTIAEVNAIVDNR